MEEDRIDGEGANDAKNECREESGKVEYSLTRGVRGKKARSEIE